MKHLDDDPIYELSTRIRNVLINLEITRLTPGGIAERFVQTDAVRDIPHP